MNKQVIQKYFNVAVEGLRNQGWKQCESSLPGSVVRHCAWSNNQPGMHCAVGHIIPEELHAGVRLTSQCFFKAYQDRLFPEDLLKAMDEDADIQLYYVGVWQGLHDNGNTPEDMEAGFRKFAKAKDLSWPGENQA